MTAGTVMVDMTGRLVIPSKVRQSLGVDGGGELMLTYEDGCLKLFSKNLARKAARKAVQSLVPAGVSLAHELSRERQQDAELDG